ncbi:hypothetical protein PHLCEN_2v9332 [Hermanssonia centrifuga]|uniref:Uncharacterized protein n=1 Tax=Hermanssonia centrifuga TaxID=98765 RepID=A0A2R6NR33_9APHY|nr:hypothetical protein PHLCEN_2v9332 [Hermanssonia centrifuga]
MDGSLGGHSTWIILLRTSRVAAWRYLSLITARANYSQAHIPVSPPYCPSPSLPSYIATHDPINTPYTASLDSSNPFMNKIKKVLALCGESDSLGPFEQSRKFVEGLNVEGGGCDGRCGI